ncbi:transmembrane protein 276-like [Stegostoma tigrinum]|uniref:transmembrane protein 276-like n=1 Tax=Stegostoma tigrinum TaxID=3053191 RepID=UPI00202B391A|nr:transmembrane protein 276-like [Stegostoma tigrinum]XP_048417383.1 transmembrane protein 276-like [Stegostoma tigrinum]XP_048417392.1 transmembrane protein 276-like [Stegostoma tigrinum]
MASVKLVPKERDWTVVITSCLLCTTALMATCRAHKVNLGCATGFLMQASAGALSAIHSYTEEPHILLTASLQDVSWLSMVIGLPLVSFGFHWLNGDHLAANSVAAVGILIAGSCGGLATEGRENAVSLAIAPPLLSILTVCLVTTNLYGILGSLAIGLVAVAGEFRLDELLGLKEVIVQNVLLTCGVAALLRALDTLSQQAETT